MALICAETREIEEIFKSWTFSTTNKVYGALTLEILGVLSDPCRRFESNLFCLYGL